MPAEVVEHCSGGSPPVSRAEFVAVLQLRRELGDRAGEASTQHQLATISLEQGDYEEARKEFVAVLQLQGGSATAPARPTPDTSSPQSA